jgi:phage terminase large subunit
LQRNEDVLWEKKREHGWKYRDHYFPRDVVNHELISPLSRIETLRSLGVNPIVVPQHDVLNGIIATRRLLDRSVIDPVPCRRGNSRPR